MTVHYPSIEQPPTHPTEIQDIYRRMLHSAGAHGRFVRRPSGQRVHVIVSGEGAALVHLHGTNTSALSHLMLAERMPARRSYLVDRPGCGLSDPAAFTRGTFCEHAIGFVDQILDGLDLDDATLVGSSGGGIWATWYALARPERVRGLVMLGSVPALPGVRLPLPIRMMATPGLGDLLARGVKPGRRMLLRLMSSMGEAETIVRHPELLDSLVAGARDRIAIGANQAEVRALTTPFGWRTAMRISPADLRRLDVPTLMIWGERDPVVPVADARAAADLIPDARLEVLAGGHVPQLGQPDQVAELLEGFTRSD